MAISPQVLRELEKQTPKVKAAGPVPAKILIIGEAPGREEVLQGKPFVGTSGGELTKMLNEAGILRTECRITNVCQFRPPGNNMDLWWQLWDKGKKKGEIKLIDKRVEEGLEELKEEINRVQPNVIIPLGNLPLWATTGEMGITKWRSSLLKLSPSMQPKILSQGKEIKVIPAIHPAAVLRKWDWRYLCVHDFRRAKRWSDYEPFPKIEENFLVKPDIQTVRSTLNKLLLQAQQGPLLLAIDIETTKRHLACLGIAWSKRDAICIPFSSKQQPSGYWEEQEELEIVLLLRCLLTHPNARDIGQNWQYDYQYLAKYWGFEINLFLDIMSEHHVQFPGLPKGLDFQSSLYADIHIYWKDEGKEMGKGDEVTWWTYNCRDCVRTYECAEVLLLARQQRGLAGSVYGTPHTIQQSLSLPMARASARGMKKNHTLAAKTLFLLQEDLLSAESWLNRILGREFNCRSNPQMSELFYEELHQAKILHRKTHRPTLDDQALDTISKRDILLRPICQAINHIRSLTNCISVCLQPTDTDGRFRCQYIIPGTETYRFSSSSDPFGFGSNLQNITSGDRTEKDFPLPNLRKLFIPDEGYTIGEFDLPQADARVVAYESGEESLISLFKDKSRHLHMENAEMIFGKRPQKTDIQYYYAKQGVHLTNYGGTPRVLAMTLGITIHEAEKFQSRYFQQRPKILDWHKKIQSQLMTRRYVENKYGYRRFYFDRIEDLLKEALAWIPQSTVAIATNLGILAVEQDSVLRSLGVQFLLQVHDSAVFQWPTHRTQIILPKMLEKMTVFVPYEKPGNLPFEGGAKISNLSWGDMVEVK